MPTIAYANPTLRCRINEITHHVTNVETSSGVDIKPGDQLNLQVDGNRAWAELGVLSVEVVSAGFSTHGLTRRWDLVVKVVQ